MNSYFANIQSIIKDAVTEEDMAMLDVIFDHVFSALSEDQVSLHRLSIAQWLSTNQLHIQKNLLGRMQWTEEDAFQFFRGYWKFEGSKHSPEVIQVMSRYLGSCYNRVAVSAFNLLDLKTLEIIAGENNYKPLFPLRNKIMDGRTDSRTIKTARDVKRMFELAVRLDAYFIVKNYFPFILEEEPVLPDPIYSSGIPIFENGVLHRPELAIEFADEDPTFSKMYDRIPCWVEKSSCKDIETARVYQWTDSFDRASDARIEDYHSRGFSSIDGTKDESNLDDYLVTLMLSKQDKLGLTIDTDRYSLIVADTLELLSMGTSPVNSERLERAKEYTSSFFHGGYFMKKLDLLEARYAYSLHPDTGFNLNVDEKQGTGGTQRVSLLEFVADDPSAFALMLKEYPDSDYWAADAPMTFEATPRQMVALQKEFGLSEASYPRIVFSADKIKSLRELGFKATSTYFLSRTRDFSFQAMVDVVRMGGRTVSDENVTTQDIVRSSSRRELSYGEIAMLLLSEHPCEIIKMCTTEKQAEAVTKLAEIHGIEEWEKTKSEWIQLLPKKIRRNALENDLGM